MIRDGLELRNMLKSFSLEEIEPLLMSNLICDVSTFQKMSRRFIKSIFEDERLVDRIQQVQKESVGKDYSTKETKKDWYRESFNFPKYTTEYYSNVRKDLFDEELGRKSERSKIFAVFPNICPVCLRPTSIKISKIIFFYDRRSGVSTLPGRRIVHTEKEAIQFMIPCCCGKRKLNRYLKGSLNSKGTVTFLIKHRKYADALLELNGQGYRHLFTHGEYILMRIKNILSFIPLILFFSPLFVLAYFLIKYL